MKKKIITTVLLGLLLSPAIFFTVFAKWTAFLWLRVAFLLRSEAALRIIMLIVFAISLGVAGVFIRLDLLGRTSRTNRAIRHTYSLLVIFLLLMFALRSEAKRFKGWTPGEAALEVAWPSSTEAQELLTLRLDSEEQVSALTRGPYRRYSVFDGDHLVCRVGISRRYGCYWVFGMREQLKEWDPNKVPRHAP
jgi:hypothetical protein